MGNFTDTPGGEPVSDQVGGGVGARRDVRAVLFDLDGTLADTLDDLADSVNHVLAAAGFTVHPTDAYRTMIGNGFTRLMQRALPEAFPKDGAYFAALRDQAADRYRRHFLDRTKPYPGIPGLLEALAREGIAGAVLSNKPHAMTVAMVQVLFGGHRFLAVHGEQAGRPLKPDPAAALGIAREAGIPAREWLYLGDSGVDMATATAAGMLPVGALWGFRQRGELLDHGAAFLVSHPREVMALIRIPR